MHAQAATSNPNKRKQLYDRVQEIAWQQQPFIYLVNKNALSAVSKSVHGVDPVALSPQTYWQIEKLHLTVERASR
jgi:ABC-type transport system substrate-binding protein